MQAPYVVYRLDVSYFSGKLEAYLQYKEIAFRRVEATRRVMQCVVVPHTGIGKVPVVHTPDDLWLQDSTPIIDFLEARHPNGSVVPGDPTQAFFSRLLEDYADEWLWRPALHYRWSYREDARRLGRRIAETALADVPVPSALAARFVARRQRALYVRGDGVAPETREHVEGIYTGTLDRLEAVLDDRPFLLGDRPSLADFGFFASMFRHFSLDPTPARIMRDRSPRTYAWVARLWAARHSRTAGAWLPPGSLPQAWTPLLEDVATGYLPYLHANAAAWRDGLRRFDWEVQGVRYRRTPVVQYRVWCRERLQEHFEALPEAAKTPVRDRLEASGAWKPLWRDGVIRSRLHDDGEPPVCRPPEVGGSLRRRGWTAWNRPGAFAPHSAGR
ncbi:MAG: glutathione S-transferase [Myxococcales bacterium]|nr:glutathione S-transferase [Myxococcales bacterium]